MRSIRSQTMVLASFVIFGSGIARGAQAQAAIITGKVTTDAGVPLPGANVFITELSISVGTNAQGAYSITVPAARVSAASGK